MKRKDFFRALALLVASPGVVGELNLRETVMEKIPAPATMTPLATGIFNDLNFVIPDYIPKYIEKYGDKDFYAVMSDLNR